MLSHLATTRRPPGSPSTTSGARQTGPFGVAVFLASDVMLFAPFFAAYFLLRSNNQLWPPPDVDLDVARAAVATAVLVASSFTMIAADRAAEHAPGGTTMRRWLLATIALGAVFLANQIAEYADLGFGADSHPYGSVYWLLTGLHGAHVASGLVAIALLYARAVRSREPAAIMPWAQGISLFWHLVDVIWLFVFTTVWVIQ